MSIKYNFSYFKPNEPGISPMGENGSPSGNGYAFAFDASKYISDAKQIGIVIYDENDAETKIPFTNIKRGTVYGIAIHNMLPDYKYNYYADDKIINDPYARALTKRAKYGIYNKDEVIKCTLLDDSFDWENDVNPCIPYEDSIFYGLNVRAFTMHSSSKVKWKGTFEGVIEKLDYINELGATSLVLMPAYDFDECEAFKEKKSPTNTEELTKSVADEERSLKKVNCWGFTKGMYFAPKASYSATNNPVNSFKQLVKEAHKKSIEIVMQFYFPIEVKQGDIIRALKFWVLEYHVDGFRVNGFNIPKRMLIEDAILSSTKLWFDNINDEEEHLIKSKKLDRYIASNNWNFINDIRRFNKGDEGLINDVLMYLKRNPQSFGVINYICDYDGFSLRDLYSYERKHNIANGENNSDGNDVNYSWNCGVEGESKKRSINTLRLSQIKNALLFVFIASGTPYIFSGDEFGNSRYGNNNSYCQDNEVNYIEWKENSFSREIFAFVKKIIALRKDNSIFHMKNEFTNMDILKSGYPDLSYHGFEAWRPDLGYNSRTIGILFYGPSTIDCNSKSFYVGINMHWENHRIALPKLKKGTKVNKIIDTSIGNGLSKDNEIPLLARSISVYEII